MQERYQGVDWRDRGTWSCNEERSPYERILEDPVALAPMEVMFVKVNARYLDAGVPSARAASAYDDWFTEAAEVRFRHTASRPPSRVCIAHVLRGEHSCYELLFIEHPGKLSAYPLYRHSWELGTWFGRELERANVWHYA